MSPQDDGTQAMGKRILARKKSESNDALVLFIGCFSQSGDASISPVLVGGGKGCRILTAQFA